MYMLLIVLMKNQYKSSVYIPSLYTSIWISHKKNFPKFQLAIRDSAVDMSPFVRKTAAHAIPKLYSIDPDSKEELVGLIEKLLGDRTTLVVGSAVMAFEEVCPERTELIHKQFRKLCNLLADIDEWGQVCNSDQLKSIGSFCIN